MKKSNTCEVRIVLVRLIERVGFEDKLKRRYVTVISQYLINEWLEYAIEEAVYHKPHRNYNIDEK